ncbi:MAG: cation:proton antiporter [Methylococcales bacterium]
MESIFHSLLMLMLVVWCVAVVMRKIGLPTIMGELIMGVVIGPAVLGWVTPNEMIETLAQIGIFFLMLHTGVETEPREFYAAVKDSFGIALVGAIVPFLVSMSVAMAFGLDLVASIFVGLTMTATAVVVTLKILRDLGFQNTRMSRIIVATCVVDDMLTMIFFSFVLGFLRGEALDISQIMLVTGKVILFFSVTLSIGLLLYPRLTFPFRNKQGKGFTFILILGFAAGEFAEHFGLHFIIGAYFAGLFFEEKIVNKKLFSLVNDRLYGLSYSFLGPIFFISLGFNITFDLPTHLIWFLVLLTLAVIVGQILSAGLMARRKHFTWIESLTIGAGHCARAEMAFIIASLGIEMGALDKNIFSVLVFTAFLLNMVTPLMLKGCAMYLEKHPAHWSY